MEKKEIIKKYNRGYIIVEKFNNTYNRIDSLYTISRYENVKAIHKKHESILDAYLKDNDVEIELVAHDTKAWIKDYDFIFNYDERDKYRLKASLQEYITVAGSDKKFLFKDLTVLYEEFGEHIFGRVFTNNKWTATKWKLNGECLFHNSSKFDLTPYEQPWYEIESNFPKYAFQLEAIGDTDEFNEYPIVFGSKEHFEMFGGDYRLATNEEIDTLKVKS